MAAILIPIETDGGKVKRASLNAITLAQQPGGDYALLVLGQGLEEIAGALTAYGANAGESWRLSPGPFAIATAIVTKETAHGIDETIKILDDLATNDVPEAELEKSKQNLIRALPASFGTNAQVAATFADLALNGIPDDFYAHYADAVRKVTAKDVKAVAKAVIPSGKMVIAIVGDMAKIRADIDALKLGEPAMHDLYGTPIATTKK